MKILTKAGLAGLAVTTATTTALMVATSGATQAAGGTTSSAFGLAVDAQGSEAIPPTPYVESTDGSEQTTGGNLPSNPLLNGGVATLSAGNDTAAVRLVDLSIGGGIVEQLPPELRDGLTQLQAACDSIPAEGEVPTLPPLPIPLPLPPAPTGEDIRELCNDLFSGELTTLAEIGVLEISCTGDSGSVSVADVSALGAPVPVPAVEPNTALVPANPLLNITANRQTPNADGSFTVDGLVIDLADGSGEVIVGSVTCGVPNAVDTPATPETPETADPRPPTATAPTPVPTRAPVTG
jgi:hypothetical protein